MELACGTVCESRVSAERKPKERKKSSAVIERIRRTLSRGNTNAWDAGKLQCGKKKNAGSLLRLFFYVAPTLDKSPSRATIQAARRRRPLQRKYD